MTLQLENFKLITDVYDATVEERDVKAKRLLDWAKMYITSLVHVFTDEVSDLEVEIRDGT